MKMEEGKTTIEQQPPKQVRQKKRSNIRPSQIALHFALIIGSLVMAYRLFGWH